MELRLSLRVRVAKSEHAQSWCILSLDCTRSHSLFTILSFECARCYSLFAILGLEHTHSHQTFASLS